MTLTEFDRSLSNLNKLVDLIELTQIQKMNLKAFPIQRLVFCPIQEVKIYSVLACVGYACK